ncbi:hypothetical protein BH11VER1_BH11VER1_14210 [soil metagenome]
MISRSGPGRSRPNKDERLIQLGAGVDPVLLSDGNLVLRSDTATLRIEGALAMIFKQDIIPLLKKGAYVGDLILRVAQTHRQEFRECLEALEAARIIQLFSTPPCSNDSIAGGSPLLSILGLIDIPQEVAQEKLAAMRVAIYGLEGFGAHLALQLAQAGVGHLVLADPFPIEQGNLSLMPPFVAAAEEASRQQIVGDYLRGQKLATKVSLGASTALSKETVAKAAKNCTALVGCFDRGFVAANYWVNSVARDLAVPAFYAESLSHRAMVGPMVTPGHSACYMCYRMRLIACEGDFGSAMDYEEFLFQQQQPMAHERAALPMLHAFIASVLATEILKQAMDISQANLMDRVLEFDALQLRTAFHPVLRRPDCPLCKKKLQRWHPSFKELLKLQETPCDWPATESKLISGRTGIVRYLHRAVKSPAEPANPVFYTAVLSNTLCTSKDEFRKGWGKGMDRAAARRSALGEALERYSDWWMDGSEIIHATYNEVSEKAINPQDMVLYYEDQYPDLPFSPYKADRAIGWVPARSLVTNRELLVPADAVFTDRSAPSNDKLFGGNSNGVATGATLAEAILSAAIEVIERDAFMICWLNRLSPQIVDPSTHPDAEVGALCEASRRRQITVNLFKLPTDNPCHVFAAATSQSAKQGGPAMVFGLGADFDSGLAARKAITEAFQIHSGLSIQMQQADTKKRIRFLEQDFRRVSSLSDHDLLYASHKSMSHCSFLFKGVSEKFAWSTTHLDIKQKLQLLRNHLREGGYDLVYFNLTTPDIAALGLHVVRAIIPGYQPIDFGWKERRLQGTRLYDLPFRLGYASARTRRESLNPAPHPLS